MRLTDKWLVGAACVAVLMAGCGASNTNGSEGESVGKLALPLVTNGPSGVRYQLRNAVFEVTNYGYYWYDVGVGGYAGTGGSTGVTTTAPVSPNVIIVNGDDNPNSDSIQVDLPEGDYSVRLRPGWYLQSVLNGEAETKEAVLLNGDYQWVYVYRHSTSWVSFQFGLGTQELWFNGKVNIGMDVYETPDQYYGGTGGSTWGPAGGSTWGPAGGSSGWPETGGAAWSTTGGQGATAGSPTTGGRRGRG